MKISLDDLEAEEMPDKAARKSTAGLTKKIEVNKEKKSAELDL